MFFFFFFFFFFTRFSLVHAFQQIPVCVSRYLYKNTCALVVYQTIVSWSSFFLFDVAGEISELTSALRKQ